MDYEIILGLRLVEGIDEIKFYEKFGVSVCDAYPKIKDLLKFDIKSKSNKYMNTEAFDSDNNNLMA